MPEPLTRREREEALIAQVWQQAKANTLHPGYLKEALDALRDAHTREDAIRALPRYVEDYDPNTGTIMEKSKHGGWLDEDDVLDILDGEEMLPDPGPRYGSLWT